jgi:hypothetical protein
MVFSTVLCMLLSAICCSAPVVLQLLYSFHCINFIFLLSYCKSVLLPLVPICQTTDLAIVCAIKTLETFFLRENRDYQSCALDNMIRMSPLKSWVVFSVRTPSSSAREGDSL